MENLPIDAESINKTIDLVSESTEETRKELDKTTAKGINKITELIWASPLGRNIDLYIAERPYKMKKALEEMKSKYEQIPEEFRVEPSAYIALKGVNEFNYSLDEEQLKEMFKNLLISDMDSRKKDRVLPSYIEIIKQLSKNDAEFLKLLHAAGGEVCAIMLKLKQKGEKYGYKPLDKYIIYNYKRNGNVASYRTSKLNKLVIDTLLMHRLIEIDFEKFFATDIATEQYDNLSENVKKLYKISENEILDYSKGIVTLTELGKNFIDICLS